MEAIYILRTGRHSERRRAEQYITLFSVVDFSPILRLASPDSLQWDTRDELQDLYFAPALRRAKKTFV